MKFWDMPYERPDTDGVKTQLRELTGRLTEAADYAAARAVFLEKEALMRTVATAATLAQVRHAPPGGRTSPPNTAN